MITSLLIASMLAQQAPAPTDSEHQRPAAHVVEPSDQRTNQALDAALDALCSKYPSLIAKRVIGASAGGVPISMLALSSDAAAADARPGVLVVAGLDGVRWASTEAVLVMAEQLATASPELLKQVTVFIVPRANPDAAGAFAAGVKRDYSGNAIPHDNDRDRRIDENPPADLNGDRRITLIRAKDLVAPYANPTLVADAADPRIMRVPDPLKGEVPQYTIFLEGVDTDGDGRISEDGPGGVVPDRNFPHRWPEFEDEAGAFPLLAPESKALADFVIAHPTLAAALVLGRVDTVVNVPDGRGRTETGLPTMIAEEDTKPYAEIAKLYRETVGQTRASDADSSGSLVAWLNAQRGVPTFGAQLWGRPDAPTSAGKASTPAAPVAEPSSTPPAVPSGTPPAAAPDAPPPTAPAAPPAGRGQRGGRGARGGAPAGPRQPAPTASEKVEAASQDDAAWLAISDAQGGAGFVPWTAFKHPQLGAVEIGGWVPGWRENPPLDHVRPLGEKCATFVAALADRRARITLSAPRVTMLGPGVYQVEATLSNQGMLASIQQGGRAADVTPANVVRLGVPIERIKSGPRMSIVRGMSPGETRRLLWVVTAAPEEPIPLDLLFVGKTVEHYEIRDGEVAK